MAKKILFVLIIITGLLIAQEHLGPISPIPGSTGKISLSPKEPKEGEVVTVTFEFTSSVDASELHVYCLPYPNTEIVGPTGYDGSIKKGETKRFITKIKLYQPGGGIRCMGARVRDLKGITYPSGKIHYWGDLATGGFGLIYDDSTQTFVGQSEYLKRRTPKKPPLHPEYTYDIVAGNHDFSGVRSETEAKKLRAQMDLLKQLDSTLTDEEALEMLHDVEVEMLVRYSISNKEESVPILIKARKLMREQGLSKWEAVDKVVEEEKKEGKLNFFRPDRNSNTGDSIGSNSTPKQKTDVTLTGTVKYKKHLIDKDTGLDTTTVDMPLRFVKLYFWCYWSGTGGHFVGPTPTDNNGQFTYTVGGVVLPDARFMPVVFLRGPSVPPGPSGFNRVKAITDTIKLTWIPSPEDSQTWRFRWKVDTVDVSYYDFGTKYCAEHFFDGGLWPDNHQPRSGAANIYDQLLKGYDYLVDNNYTLPDTIYKVVARWQPGCTLGTYFIRKDWPTADTIIVIGDTLGSPFRHINTDEWDNLGLLHEYGHHVMNRCAVVPPETTRAHYWYKSYATTDTFVGYAEGWPHLFAGVVSGNIYDINTLGMIGDPDDTTGYHNVENPWDFRVIPPFPSPADSFEGGPYCEGAVCGALWDIYDATDEIPYPSYPDSLNGVWFPDTALADSLTMDFDEIWNISDNYEWLGHYCWTIHDFLRGWGNYHYNHQFELEQILLHHRILWDVPAAPVGLQANYDPGIPGVVLTWLKNIEPDLYKYFIYRKFDYPESSFVKIGAPFPSLDTNFVDTNVEYGNSYWYAVTAMDSSGFESELSDSVLVRLALYEETDNPIGTGYNNATRIIRYLYRGRGYELLLAFSSEGDVKCVSSSDEGVTWSQSQVIGQGQFPTLVLDSGNNPCCLFGRWVGPGGFGSAQLYYTKYVNNHWTTPALLMSVDSVYIGIPEYAIPAPSVSIDSQDTIHVTWMSPMGQEYIHRFAVWYGNLYAFDTVPVFNYVQLDTIWVYESSPCPTLAIDGLQTTHVVYETDPAAPTLFYRYRESGIWREKEAIESEGCYYPDLEFFGDRIHLVWDYRYPDTTVAHELHYRSKSAAGWDTIMNIYEPLPFNVFGEPVNAGGWYTVWANQDIYYSRFNGTYWEQPETVQVTPEISAHPTAMFRQDMNDTCLYIAWTEGDSAPFTIQFEKITVPSVPRSYANLGQPIQSPYCLERDGYWIFGDKPYESVDYDNDSLVYRFTNLDPAKEYRLDLAYYFEPNPAKSIENSDNIRPDKTEKKDIISSIRSVQKGMGLSEDIEKGIGRLIQALVIDGAKLDSAFIVPHKLVRVSIWLPNELYADGEIIIEIEKIKGKVVVCGEMALYEFSGEEKKDSIANTKGGPQSNETTYVNSILFQGLYPNPAKKDLKVRLNSPDERKVTVKLYDVTGRLVDEIFNGKLKVGTNEIPIRSKKLAAGVYFIRLETSGYEKTEKIILLR